MKTDEELMELDRLELIHRQTCSRCGELKPLEVETRYSFGVYAGRLCVKCCGAYRDNCGLDQPQGDYKDLDEPYWEE